MNVLWSSMLLLGIVYGAIQGRMPEVTDGVIRASREAVVLAVSLVGVTGFWAGLMEFAKKAGVIDGLVRMGPVLQFCLRCRKRHPAMRAAGMNMICNVFGLGAAATPPGLAAMERFEELEEERRKTKNPAAVPEGTANWEMCTFLILNISSLQLIINVSCRNQYGSVHPTAIIGPALHGGRQR
ncbi:MAG: nucleoside recognition protein [Fusicatenibacter saccharivorans]